MAKRTRKTERHIPGGAVESAECKRAEEALRQSEEKLRAVFESAAEGITVTDLEGNILEANEEVVRQIGYTKEEYIGRKGFEFLSPKDLARAVEDTARRLTEGYIGTVEYAFLRKDGTECSAEVNASFIRDASGNPVAIVSITRDISEHKRAEAALMETEQQLTAILNGVIDGILLADVENRKFYAANQAICHMTGYSQEEILNLGFMDIHPEESLPCVAQQFERQMKEPGLATDIPVKKKDGSLFYCDINSSPLTLDGRKYLLGVFRDITERKRAEENQRKLQQELSVSSRLATVGQLASGVAHEINNPLTAVIGFSQMLMAKDIPEDTKEYLQIIDQSAQRVAKIVKNLLTFARQRKPGRERVDLNSLISRVIELRTYNMKNHNIEVTTEFASDLPLTMADGGQLQQVFLNIILNAEQAMVTAHNKGNLLVKTEGRGGNIRISLKDDGPGIDSENLDKIFNPFFTTKSVGEGTGLGLSISYGIIKEHGGKLYAESTLGQGATFVVELPIVNEPQQPDLPQPSVEQAGRIAGARIMVVDDEPAICQLLKHALTKDGHNVETVDGASIALARLERERYDLILLDVQMAGIDGIELYKRMGEIAVSLQRRVVFITGDTMTPTTQNFLKEAKARCISKPFDVEQLKKDIRQILLREKAGLVSAAL